MKPARYFRVFLRNDSGFDITRVPDQTCLEGTWTSKDWEPPGRISDGEEKAFQSESGDWLQGTEGWEVYEIQDGTAAPDQLRLHFDNPYWGSTEAHPTILTSTGVFEDRVPANHFDPGRRDAELGRATGEQSVSKNFTLEVSSPRALDSVATDGWLEIVQGYLILPIPLGPIDHAVVNFRVSKNPQSSQPQPPVSGFGSQAGTRSYSFVPAQGAPSEAWNGSFAFPGGTLAIAQVGTTIATEGQTSKFLLVRLRGASYHATVKETPSLTINQGGVNVTTASALTYSGDLWPPKAPSFGGGMGRFISPGSSVTNGALAANPSAPVRLTPGLQGSLLRAGLSSDLALAQSNANQTSNENTLEIPKGGLTVAQHLALQASMVRVTDTADALSLPFGVTLMLYSMHLANGHPVGYSVRYLRRAGDGKSLVDVMLTPAVEAPS